MREITGNLWDFHIEGNWIAVTTNGVLNTRGEAVMGRGVAEQAAFRFPYIREKLGRRIARLGNHVAPFASLRIVAFPVKHHWKERADLNLIRRSCTELIAVMSNIRFGMRTIYLPRPGCGNGGLDWENVRNAIFELLPDTVIVVSLQTHYNSKTSFR